MKTLFRFILILSVIIISCGKENRWKIELPQEKVELEITDISKDFFDTNIPLAEVQQKYPFFFLDTVSNETWEKQRKHPFERAVYDSVVNVFQRYGKLETDLEELFTYYKYYFPQQTIPHVYTFSSTLQENIFYPVIYGAKEGLMFIALDGFLGSGNQLYKQQSSIQVYDYMVQNMNPENLAPAVVQAIGQEIVPLNIRQQTFIDLIIDEGKKLVLADALLPETSDELKIGYTKEQLSWAIANEGDIWNYFVEQNMVFDSDKSLRERFLQPAPFSKFANEIEQDSPGRIGVWIGWQICRKYLDENPEMTLEQFINQDTQVIFKESKYKPKKGNSDYTPAKKRKNDEVEK